MSLWFIFWLIPLMPLRIVCFSQLLVRGGTQKGLSENKEWDPHTAVNLQIKSSFILFDVSVKT